MTKMISTSEAISIIMQNVHPLPERMLALADAGALVLSSDVISPGDFPAYPQSSMDGYAFAFDGWQQHRQLRVTGEMAAGDSQKLDVSNGTAVRIFTGAPVPPGADTVIMQERTLVENGVLTILDDQLNKGASVRLPGSEARAGTLALPAGTLLSPAAIGFLAGLGLQEVPVHPNPRIRIIITGNELQLPGLPLTYGQVYDSSSFALRAALRQLQIPDVTVSYVKDDPDAITGTLSGALNESDIVLLTGGVSVGDYDFVPRSAANCEVETLFHRVRQKPGKPLYFGKNGEKLVFGLPGNPSSVLTCFYLYVLPALELLRGRQPALRTLKVPLSCSFSKPAGLTHYLKGFFDGDTAKISGAQESYRMRSFALANCLVQLDEQATVVAEGTPVTIHLLPALH
jgi:molybdopterin molybdotransferase